MDFRFCFSFPSRVTVLTGFRLSSVTTTSRVDIPTKENTNVAPTGTLMLQFPSASVVVPTSVPFIWMLIPGSGLPSSDEFSRPEIVRSCADNELQANKKMITVKILIGAAVQSIAMMQPLRKFHTGGIFFYQTHNSSQRRPKGT